MGILPRLHRLRRAVIETLHSGHAAQDHRSWAAFMRRKDLLIEGRIDKIDVFLIHLLLSQAHRLAKALEVDDLPFTEEADDVVDIGVIGKTQDIVVGNTRFLLCCNHIRTTCD